MRGEREVQRDGAASGAAETAGDLKAWRVNWGCGPVRPATWTNVDLAKGKGIDASCDIVRDGLPFEDDSFLYISSQHALQQLKVIDLLPALRELLRVLRPGGVLRLCLPDLDKAIEDYRQGRQKDFWSWDWDSLSGNFISYVIDYNYTRTPLTYEFARELLYRAGFVDVRRVAHGQTASSHRAIVELDSRPDESFFVEAVKSPVERRRDQGLEGPQQVHLSWAHDPSRSLTVIWRGASGLASGEVEYREIGTAHWRHEPAAARDEAAIGRIFQAALSGLEPDTGYEYLVRNGDAKSAIFRTRTAPGPGPADFRFAFVCDTGIAGREDGLADGVEQVIRELAAADPLFVLGGGDYAYADRDRRFADVREAVDAWFRQVEPLIARCPFMAQYGNHEVALGERFRDWSLRFAHPAGFGDGRNYSFDVGMAHFTALFVPDAAFDPGQTAWLEADLADARARGVRWLVVYQHEPMVGHGRSHPATPEVRGVLAPIFERHRVDLHLSGHDQNYERTYPLLDAASTPRITSDSQDHYPARTGVIYAKVSPGGKMSDIRGDFSRFTAGPPAFVAARDDTMHHFALVSVIADLELVVDVYGVIGDGSPRRLIDSFRITARPDNS
jgi:SAM-dependent methyltransferase